MNPLDLTNFDEEDLLADVSDASAPDEDPGVSAEQMFTESQVQTMLEEIRAQALAEGHKTGAAQALAEAQSATDAQVSETLTALEGSLSELAVGATQRRAEMEHTIVDLALGVCERLVPEILHVHAPDIVAARIRSGVRMATGEAGLTIRVAQDLAPRISTLLESWIEPDVNSMEITVEPTSDLPVGAARLVWKNGYLDYDLDHACTALLSELRDASRLMTETLGRTE